MEFPSVYSFWIKIGMRDIKRGGGNFSYHTIPVIVEDESVGPALLSWQWPIFRKHPPIVTSITVPCESPEAVLLNESLSIVTADIVDTRVGPSRYV